MTEQKLIYQALANVMADVRAVAKDDFHDSPAAKFKFRGVDAVTRAVAPALRTHGVLVLPVHTEVGYRDVKTSGGKPAREVTVLVRYQFIASDGSMVEVCVPGEALDHGDKGTAKSMSVAFRIALLQALCLPTGEPDPDHDAYERAEPEPSEADRLREEILLEAKERNIPAKLIAQDFQARTQMDIREADAELLSHFLGHLRTGIAPRGEPVAAE